MPSFSVLAALSECPNCGKRYKYKFNLTRHIRYECGVDKQFSCPECGKNFAQKHNLKSHVIMVHKNFLAALKQGRFSCCVTDIVAQSEKSLKHNLSDCYAMIKLFKYWISQNRYCAETTYQPLDDPWLKHSYLCVSI